MRLPLFLLISACGLGCGARVLWTGEDGQPGNGGGSTTAEPMGIWDEVPCPGYFDGLTCPPGCPVRVYGDSDPQLPGHVYCASACSVDEDCPTGTACFEDRCLFPGTDVQSCRPNTGLVVGLEYCAPWANGLVRCAPFQTDDGTCANDPDDGCSAKLDLPDGTTFCTLDCAAYNIGNPCVSGALCPWDSPPLPDGRTLCLPICESDADCFGGLTCTDGVCQWPAQPP
jgi:hypothetical protein